MAIPAARRLPATLPIRCRPIWSASTRGRLFGAIVPSGTRDPVFFANYDAIKVAVMKLIEDEFPDALAKCELRHHRRGCFASGRSCCVPSIATPGYWRSGTSRRSSASRGSRSRVRVRCSNLDAPDAYAWSLYHLLQNEDVIMNAMFPITYFRGDRRRLAEQRFGTPALFRHRRAQLSRQRRRPNALAHCRRPPAGAPIASHRLLDMAVVIRSKDAGINRLTFDIIFTSGENYEAALHSNVFTARAWRSFSTSRAERVVGTLFRRQLQRD